VTTLKNYFRIEHVYQIQRKISYLADAREVKAFFYNHLMKKIQMRANGQLFWEDLRHMFVHIPIIFLLVKHFADKNLAWYRSKIHKLKRRLCSNRK